jgi:hypothetical protein
MTEKLEKLEAVKVVRNKVIAAEDRYLQWKMRSENTVVVLKQKTNTGTHENWRENAIIEMAEARENYLDCVMQYIDSLRDAYTVLNALENPDWYTVLYCRYIRIRAWKDIAEEMKCSERNCKLLNQEARSFLCSEDGHT